VSFRRFRRLTGDLIASAREVLTRTRFIRAMTIKLDPTMVREMRLAWADRISQPHEACPKMRAYVRTWKAEQRSMVVWRACL